MLHLVAEGLPNKSIALRLGISDHTVKFHVNSIFGKLGAQSRTEAVTQAMRYTRDAGRVVVVGQYTDHGETAFNPHLDLNKKHLDVLGCWGSDYSHFHCAVELLRNERAAAAWSSLELRGYNLAQANEALADVAAGKTIKATIAPTV